MTNAELEFMAIVPASIHRIAAAAEKIAAELSKANRLKAIHVMLECEPPIGFKTAVVETLGKELGFIKDSADGDGGKEGAEP